MTRTRRAAVPLAPTAPRLLNAKDRSLDRPDTASAGVSPHAMLVTSVIARPKASTCMSTDRSGRRGIDAGPSSTSARTKQTATPAPAAPPSIPRTRLSVSNCATSWRRLAPRAARTATSRRRACPRASSRFATFAQAMSSTSVTAPNRVTNVGRMSPTIRSCSGVTSSVASFSVWGNSVARRSTTVCSAMVAWLGDTASFKRATTCTHCAPRAAGARSAGLKMSGCQNSAAAGNFRAAGATGQSSLSGHRASSFPQRRCPDEAESRRHRPSEMTI
jgi:hypothetical protein